jgi:RNA recognition motif-containing protein
MNRKLYVGNLSYETTETDLQTLFGQSGSVESVRVMRDMATGRARGFAFVEMASETDAQTAINQIHEKEFGGRTLTVNEARPQPARGGGFSGGDDRDAPRRRSEPRW